MTPVRAASERMKNDDDALIEAAKAVRDALTRLTRTTHVGSAVLDENGRIHSGCNVENAAYPGRNLRRDQRHRCHGRGGWHPDRRDRSCGRAAGAGSVHAVRRLPATHPRILRTGTRASSCSTTTASREATSMDELLPASFQLR